MYGDFVWWQGVVEDRADSLMLGRCRVRILGYHTDNKQDIPTNTLPWATPIQPITSAAMSGVGTTPFGPVEGTWVFGFFRDGKNAQEPVMMGTFGGIPEAGANPVLGFNDPNGRYPLLTNLYQPDTNKLARGHGDPVVNDVNGEDAPSLIRKRKSRNLEVPIGVAGDMSGEDGKGTIANTDDTGDAELYTKVPWNEPNPRYGGVETSDTKYLDSVKMSSQYPHNHVRMGESGHVEEWDDTPSAERLHKFHTSGTFEEIQPDGTKVTKIVGNEYEITLGYKNVVIDGYCNVTIKGDCRMLYLGDLVQEVYGDYHLNVHKDMRTKISGNEAREVLADRKIVINGEDDLNVGKNQIINIADDLTYTVGGNLKETVKKNVTETYGDGATPGDHSTQCAGKYSYKSINSTTLTAFGDFRISCDANMFINVTNNYKMIVNETSNIRVDGTGTEEIKGNLQESYRGTQTTNVTGKITITSGPEIDMDAGVINLN
jgi:hypothetical protein